MAMSTQNIPAALSAYDSFFNGLSPQDLENVNAMIQSAGYWTDQTGFTPTLGTIPGPGTPSTKEQQITGWYLDPTTGQRSPILAAQEAYGGSADNPTLAAGEALGYVFGKPTLARQGQEFNQGMGVANLVAGLNGPRDAFSQQAVEHGLDSMGLSKAVDAVAGRANLPTVQAPQAAPTAESLSSLVAGIRNGGSPAVGSNGGGVGGAGGFSANDGLATPAQTGGSASNSGGAFSTPSITQRYIDALPDPNKIVSSEWQKLDPDTQQFLTGAYGQKGYSASDLNQAINSNLPQFKAPTASNSAFGSGFVGV